MAQMSWFLLEKTYMEYASEQQELDTSRGL